MVLIESEKYERFILDLILDDFYRDSYEICIDSEEKRLTKLGYKINQKFRLNLRARKIYTSIALHVFS